jgi:HEAT repeat protein
VGAQLAYHCFLLGLAILGAASTVVGLYVVSADTLRPALSDLQHDPTAAGIHATLLLVLVAVAPVAAAAIAYYIGWQTIRLFQLAGYLRRLRHFLASTLHTQAPLLRLGFIALGLPFAPDGQPSVGGELPLATLLAQAPGVLLLGDAGVGKTVALRQYALMLSRRRHVLAIAMGHAPLPVLVSLPAYAAAPAEPDQPRLRFLAAQIRAFGHRRLASRLLVALPRWHVTLLCDGLDEVPAAQREPIAAELAQLTTAPYARVRVVTACGLDTYLREPASFGSLTPLARVVATGLLETQLSQVLRQAARVYRAPGKSTRDVVASASTSGLGAQIGHPATLTAFLQVHAAGMVVAPGRTRLLHAYADLLCKRASGPDRGGARLKLILGRLASALRRTEGTYLPVNVDESAGDAVRQLLLTTDPLMPCARQVAPPFEVAAVDLTREMSAATRATILEWHADGLGLGFAQGALASVFAAIWLDHMDDPQRPLSAELLETTWREPVLLWSGLTAQPEQLVTRLLDLGDNVEEPPRLSRSSRARITVGQAATRRTHATALALAVALEGLVPPLAARADTVPPGQRSEEAVELCLRDLFEYIQLSFGTPDQHSAFAEVIMTLERDCGCDLAVHLATVTRANELGRLVRAQSIAMLGILASPGALEALTSLLAETDPVLRQAVDAAFAAAGPAGVGALQNALSSSDERVRLRATDALSQGGAAAVRAALAGLNGPDARQRAASARALGALQAEAATEPLLARLDDGDASVRIAAAWALSQVATPRLLGAVESHLHSSDPELRATLTLALGSIRHARTLQVLVDLLADPAAQVRAAAAEALGRLGDERAVSPLRDRLADSDPWAQAAAATALRRLSGR